MLLSTRKANRFQPRPLTLTSSTRLPSSLCPAQPKPKPALSLSADLISSLAQKIPALSSAKASQRSWADVRLRPQLFFAVPREWVCFGNIGTAGALGGARDLVSVTERSFQIGFESSFSLRSASRPVLVWGLGKRRAKRRYCGSQRREKLGVEGGYKGGRFLLPVAFPPPPPPPPPQHTTNHHRHHRSSPSLSLSLAPHSFLCVLWLISETLSLQWPTLFAPSPKNHLPSTLCSQSSASLTMPFTSLFTSPCSRVLRDSDIAIAIWTQS